jgi:hypothetical protein
MALAELPCAEGERMPRERAEQAAFGHESESSEAKRVRGDDESCGEGQEPGGQEPKGQEPGEQGPHSAPSPAQQRVLPPGAPGTPSNPLPTDQDTHPIPSTDLGP